MEADFLIRSDYEGMQRYTGVSVPAIKRKLNPIFIDKAIEQIL